MTAQEHPILPIAGSSEPHPASVSDLRSVRLAALKQRFRDLLRLVVKALARSGAAVARFVGALPSFLNGLAKVAASLSALAALGLLVYLLVDDLKRHSITIAEINVPSDLGARGYTSSVAEARFRDALNHYYNQIRKTLPLGDLQVTEEPTVTVPELGLPFNFVADSLAPLFGITPERVSGEFTESAGKLWLQIRVNDRTILVKDIGNDSASGADALFAETAPDFFAQIEPYIVVAHFYTTGQETAAGKMANTIINGQRRATAEDVVWSHIILGVMLLDHANYTSAAAELLKASTLEQKNAVAHNELGRVYFSEGNWNDASREYSAAVELAPKWALPVQGLGDVYSTTGQPALAQAEYNSALQLEHRQ